MSLIVLVGGTVYTLVSLVLGVRLLRLAARTQGLPELTQGLAYLCGGTLSATLWWILNLYPAEAESPIDPATRATLLTILLVAWRVSLAAHTVSAWWIFRRHAWGFAILCFINLLNWCSYLPDAAIRWLETVLHTEYAMAWLGYSGRVAAYSWLGIEALVYASKLKRRWQYGLEGDLVLASRMRFWGLGLLSLAIYSVILFVSLSLTRRGIHWPVPAPTMNATFGVVAALCHLYAFFPPQHVVQQLEAKKPPLAA